MNPNLYSVLGVTRDTSPADLRTRYRELARKLHPDAAPDDAAAEERFKEIGRAYEVLSDPERRRLYDEFGEVSLHPSFDADAARQSQRGFAWNGVPGRGFGRSHHPFKVPNPALAGSPPWRGFWAR